MKFKIEPTVASVNGIAATLFRVGFGEPAQNDEVVREVASRIAELESDGNFGGRLALVNGPASLPVAVQLGHALAHRFGSVAIFDPKMAGYVVSLSHGGPYPVGAIVPAADVK